MRAWGREVVLWMLGMIWGKSCYCQQSLISTSFHTTFPLEGIFDIPFVLDSLVVIGRTTTSESPLDMTARDHLSSGSTEEIQSESGRGLLQRQASISVLAVPSNTGISTAPFFPSLDSAVGWCYNAAHSHPPLLFVNHYCPRLLNISCLSILNLDPKGWQSCNPLLCSRTVSGGIWMLSAVVHPSYLGPSTWWSAFLWPWAERWERY